jgi:hypothetical protein
MPLFDPAAMRSDVNSVPRARTRLASIVSVQTGYTCTIKFLGDSANVSGVLYLGSVAPKPGSVALVDTDGLQLIVVGSVAGNGGHWPVCRAWRNSAQTGVASATLTRVTFEAADDPWSMWNGAGIITAPIDGFYSLTGVVAFAAASTGAYRNVELLEGSTVRARTRFTGTMAGGTSPFVTATTVEPLVKGADITMEASSDQTGPFNFAQTGQFPHLVVAYLGPAA